MTTATLNVRMDASLKSEVDRVAKSIGLTSTAVFNVFARQFVAHRGFPFAVVEPSPTLTQREYAEEMDTIYAAMKDGAASPHDLVEA